MTAACRNPGTMAEPICVGCSVNGFSMHDCIREALKIDSRGHAEVAPCSCQVEQFCRGHRPVPKYGFAS